MAFVNATLCKYAEALQEKVLLASLSRRFTLGVSVLKLSALERVRAVLSVNQATLGRSRFTVTASEHDVGRKLQEPI